MRRTKANQKGKSRHFSTPEEIQSQMAKIDLNEESVEEASGSGSDDSSDDDRDSKPKGVSGLIEIENPNRVTKKPTAATAAVNDTKVELSRREREEIEKQKAKERYQKLHAEGKTDQAKADLARLAAIRQKREQEALKRKEEARIREEDSKRSFNKAIERSTLLGLPKSEKCKVANR